MDNQINPGAPTPPGAQVPPPQQPPQQPVPPPQQTGEPQGGSTDTGDAKIWAIIGYIIPILFFIPLVMDNLKNNQFARFHANQQLVLLLFWVVGTVLTVVIIGFFVQLFAFILMIVGIINAAGGKMSKLWLIGGINIIK